MGAEANEPLNSPKNNTLVVRKDEYLRMVACIDKLTDLAREKGIY